LEFKDARAFATPRRLTLVVDGLPAARADVREDKRGPRVGAPDQAVQGFLKSAGLASLDQAQKRDTGQGEVWVAVIHKNGGPTAAHVILDAAERKRIVLAGAQKLCAEAQVSLKPDEGLLEEVAGLIEWPVPLLGTIDGQFLELPPEVLLVSVRTHQRYFPTAKP